MRKDLKTRADAYAHSYPFAKVADAYEAGAKEERKQLNEWHDASKKPTKEGLYLSKATYECEGMLYECTLVTQWVDGHWVEPLIATSEEYGFNLENFVITAWREIHENE